MCGVGVVDGDVSARHKGLHAASAVCALGSLRALLGKLDDLEAVGTFNNGELARRLNDDLFDRRDNDDFDGHGIAPARVTSRDTATTPVNSRRTAPSR
ncbi:hypothetical protein D3C87_1895710 [compost metagenome]